jgi:NADPH:quinone reductase-like Zn-dependent oxidoreductase
MRMKACRLKINGHTNHFVIEETERPRPMPRQVLVRMRAASLNRRDIMLAEDRLGVPIPPHGMIPLSDGSGDVVEVGAEVTRFAPGDRVAGAFFQTWISGTVTPRDLPMTLGGPLDGVLAEYCALDEAGLVHVPEHLSYEESSTLPCAAVTAWNALFEGKPLRMGQTVLVMGAGGVSMFALQFARAAGARVIAISSNESRLEHMRNLGAWRTINYLSNPDWSNSLMQLTEQRGADHVVDIGGAESLPKSIASVAMGGCVSVVGVMTFGGVELAPLIAKSATLRGIAVGSRDMFEAMNRAMVNNDLHPVIGQRMNWHQVADAYAHMKSGAHIGKIVLSL